MLNIGTHLSSAAGFYKMGLEALKIKANTLQFFARNPRGMKAKPFNLEDTQNFHQLLQKNHFAPIIAHAPYTLNACSLNGHVRELACQIISEDLALMEHLPGNYYNLHPGSGQGQDIKTATAKTAEILNQTMKEGQQTTVLLETMAGKGTEIGKTFEELKMILDQIKLQDKIGICFDACHLFDSGYDVKNNLDAVLEQFDRTIGLNRLKAFHLNDSKNPCGSKKDRHEKIGNGYIGSEAAVNIINHPVLRSLPFILETPNDLAGHAEEIRYLKSAFITAPCL